MSEIAKPPRFPYVAALLCAACLGAAAWTWISYSYAWNVAPREFWHGTPPSRRTFLRLEPVEPPARARMSLVGTYVRVRGTYRELWLGNELDHVQDPDDADAFVRVRMPDGHEVGEGEAVVLSGRVSRGPHEGDEFSMQVDVGASRFTGASVAGLVVGAMGVFVFTVALGHWLRESRG
ncbi:MAG: hypothetical protein ACYSU0_23130 [Planctomycetota bacterium]